MGQVVATIQDKIHGRQWKERQIRKITDHVFDHIRDADSKSDGGGGGGGGGGGLSFADLYIAVLRVYNEINKRLPGPHHDPPSREKLKAMIQEYDINLDGLLDREEFAEFIRKLTADTITAVSRNLIIALVVTPTLALMTKRATEGVPHVGKVVQRLPNSVYALIVALGVVLAQKSGECCE